MAYIYAINFLPNFRPPKWSEDDNLATTRSPFELAQNLQQHVRR